MTRPECRDCHRRLLRPSPDGLGPVCRRKHAPLPPRPVPRVTPLPRRSNRTGGLIPGQQELDLEPQETP